MYITCCMLILVLAESHARTMQLLQVQSGDIREAETRALEAKDAAFRSLCTTRFSSATREVSH